MAFIPRLIPFSSSLSDKTKLSFDSISNRIGLYPAIITEFITPGSINGVKPM